MTDEERASERVAAKFSGKKFIAGDRVRYIGGLGLNQVGKVAHSWADGIWVVYLDGHTTPRLVAEFNLIPEDAPVPPF